jgi:hypothetical protein
MWRGATGNEVKELQKFLKDYYDLGDDTLPASGYFGRVTQNYVAQFQKDNGLTPGTPGLTIQLGVVNNTTRQVILARACPNPDKPLGNINPTNSTQPSTNKSRDYSSAPVGTYYEDFNFDGLQDKLVITGRGSGQIYVQTTSGNYVSSEELNKILYIGERGYFYVDYTNKKIITGGARSCCNHSKQEYIVIPGGGLQKVYSISEDNNVGDAPDGQIRVTIEEPTGFGGSLIKKVNYYDINKYQSVLTSNPAPVVSAELNVSGMKKYTDSSFGQGGGSGYSFWYPDGWTVINNSDATMFAGSTDYAGNNVIGKITIKSPAGHTVTISKVYSANNTYKVNAGACGSCAPINYSFDTNKGWLISYPQGIGGAPDAPQSVIEASKLPQPIPSIMSKKTMGNLNMFTSGQRESAYVVPLSPNQYLFVIDQTYSEQCGSGCASANVKGGANYFASTITSPGLTQVTISEQQKVVEAERKAYLGY